jgi:hypothetical protein
MALFNLQYILLAQYSMTTEIYLRPNAHRHSEKHVLGDINGSGREAETDGFN